LSTEVFIKRARAARMAQALCGVMRQFFAVSNGLSAGGGSVGENVQRRGGDDGRRSTRRRARLRR
jgi:hypothetical protein